MNGHGVAATDGSTLPALSAAEGLTTEGCGSLNEIQKRPGACPERSRGAGAAKVHALATSVAPVTIRMEPMRSCRDFTCFHSAKIQSTRRTATSEFML